MIPMKRRRIWVSLLLALAVVVASCNRRPPDEEIVARVGDVYLTHKDLEKRLDLEGFSPDQINRYVERWVNREVLYQEAQRLGLENTEELAWELELVEKEFLINKLLERTYAEKVQVTEEMVTSYYQSHQDLFRVNEDFVHVFHLVTETREAANLARQSLLAGRPFEDVAREYSVGPFKDRGGDMGFIKESDVIPELRRIAFRSSVNDVSSVISSSYGYHVIKVVDKLKKDDVRPLVSVRDEIVARLRANKEQQVYYDLLYKLQNESNIHVALPSSVDSLRMGQ